MWLCLYSQNKSQAPTCHIWHFSSSSTSHNYLLDRILEAGTVPSYFLLSAPALWARSSPLHSTWRRPPGYRHTGSFSWKKFFSDLAGIKASKVKPLTRKELEVFQYGKAEVHWLKWSICNECSKRIKFIKLKIRKYPIMHIVLWIPQVHSIRCRRCLRKWWEW